MGEKLGRILDRIISEAGISRRLKEARVLSLWECEVGPEISRFAQASRMQRGILYVLVENSVWATELTFLKRDLARRLNSCVGGCIIKDIRFLVGKPGPRTPIKSGCDEPITSGTDRPRGGERSSSIPAYSVSSDIAGAIRDPALRSAFLRALSAARRVCRS